MVIVFCYRMDDKYFLQNKAIAEFRKFSFLKNVHVSIVMHPRKVGCVFILFLSFLLIILLSSVSVDL